MIWRSGSGRSLKKIFAASASWARRFRSGRAENRCSRWMAVSAMHGGDAVDERDHRYFSGSATSLWERLYIACSAGAQHRAGAAGRGVLARICARREGEDHLRAVALAPGRAAGARRIGRCRGLHRGRKGTGETKTALAPPGRHTATTRAPLAFSSTNSCGGSLPAPSQIIGAKYLPNRLLSTSGSDYRPKRMPGPRPFIRRGLRAPRRRTTSTARWPAPTPSNARPLPRRAACTRSAP